MITERDGEDPLMERVSEAGVKALPSARFF